MAIVPHAFRVALVACGRIDGVFGIGDFQACGHASCWNTTKFVGTAAYDFAAWHDLVMFWNWPDKAAMQQLRPRCKRIGFMLALETIPSREYTAPQREILDYLNGLRLVGTNGEWVNVYEDGSRDPAYAVHIEASDPDEITSTVQQSIWKHYGADGPTHLGVDCAAQMAPYYGSATNGPTWRSPGLYRDGMERSMTALGRIAPIFGNTNGSDLHVPQIAYSWQEHTPDELAYNRPFPILRNQARNTWPAKQVGRPFGVLCSRSGGYACKGGA